MTRRELSRAEQDLVPSFQPSQVSTELPMQISYSGPDAALYSIELLYLKMIATAKERIYISTP